MSVKYSWSRQNGAAVPPVRFMSIEPAEDYYKGMPLKLKEKGIVEPTDGDPEYICMAQYDPDAEIQPLEIPVQEVFPDVVYDRMNEDGTIEEVRFGSKGGGADVLNENGKLKNEVLPEGYPSAKENIINVFCENVVDFLNGSVEVRYLFIDRESGYNKDCIYKVVCDGEVYYCPVKQAGYNSYIGNNSLATKQSGNLGVIVDTGEPFFIGWHNYMESYYMFDQAGEHTYSIYEVEEEVTRMNRKYLPLDSPKIAIIQPSYYDEVLNDIHNPVGSQLDINEEYLANVKVECINMTYKEVRDSLRNGDVIQPLLRGFRFKESNIAGDYYVEACTYEKAYAME